MPRKRGRPRQKCPQCGVRECDCCRCGYFNGCDHGPFACGRQRYEDRSVCVKCAYTRDRNRKLEKERRKGVEQQQLHDLCAELQTLGVMPCDASVERTSAPAPSPDMAEVLGASLQALRRLPDPRSRICRTPTDACHKRILPLSPDIFRHMEVDAGQVEFLRSYGGDRLGSEEVHVRRSSLGWAPAEWMRRYSGSPMALVDAEGHILFATQRFLGMMNIGREGTSNVHAVLRMLAEGEGIADASRLFDAFGRHTSTQRFASQTTRTASLSVSDPSSFGIEWFSATVPAYACRVSIAPIRLRLQEATALVEPTPPPARPAPPSPYLLTVLERLADVEGGGFDIVKLMVVDHMSPAEAVATVRLKRKASRKPLVAGPVSALVAAVDGGARADQLSQSGETDSDSTLHHAVSIFHGDREDSNSEASDGAPWVELDSGPTGTGDVLHPPAHTVVPPAAVCCGEGETARRSAPLRADLQADWMMQDEEAGVRAAAAEVLQHGPLFHVAMFGAGLAAVIPEPDDRWYGTMALVQAEQEMQWSPADYKELIGISVTTVR